MKLDQLNEKSQFEWFVGFAEGDGSLGPLQPATGSRLFGSSSSATDISDTHQAASE